MVSFRLSQFRALLLSLLLTDALCHRQLSLPMTMTRQGWAAKLPTIACHPAVQLPSDRWCQALTQSCQYLTTAHTADPAYWPTQQQAISRTLAHASTAAETILAVLPLFLQTLDTPDPWRPWLSFVPTAHRQTVLIFYRAIVITLNSDAQTMGQPLTPLLRMHEVAAEVDPVVAVAIDLAQTAAGDFALTYAQSCQTSASLPGLPLLSGLLSAGWHGEAGLPNWGAVALRSPTLTCRQWLEQRWHLVSAHQVDTWALACCHRWMGRYGELLPDRDKPQSTPMNAMLPVGGCAR